MALLIPLLALALAYGLTIAPSLTWANNGADGGDYAAAILTWGVPHPTGYPTYVLIGRLFMALPIGEPAFELALLSAVSMALAGGLLANCIFRSLPGGVAEKLWPALAAGLAFGLAPIPWSQALIGEVHALHSLLIILTLAFIGTIDRASEPAMVILAALGLLVGLALGNHLTYVFMLPILFLLLLQRRRSLGPRRLRLVVAAFIAGLCVYLYLPLAAKGHPPINWGDPSDLRGFLWLIRAAPYQELAFSLPAEEIPQRLGALAALLVDQFGVPGVALAVLGLVFGRSDSVWIDRATYWLVPVYSFFALGYNTADSIVYLIPAYVGAAWWLGLGVRVLLDNVRGNWPRWVSLAGFVVLVAIVVRAPDSAGEVDARTDRRAVDFLEQVVADVPPGAAILTTGTEDTFALWYAHFGLGQRPDLHILVAPLVRYDWYRETIAASYPDLIMPEPELDEAAGWISALLARNSLTACQTRISMRDDLPVASLICPGQDT